MLKKNTKVKHIKHGEGLVVGNSGRFILVKYTGYKRPIKQNIKQIGVTIEILGYIEADRLEPQDKNIENKLNNLQGTQQKKMSDKEIKNELHNLRRQLMNRNHKYELEGFVSEETILRRINELENMLFNDKK